MAPQSRRRKKNIQRRQTVAAKKVIDKSNEVKQSTSKTKFNKNKRQNLAKEAPMRNTSHLKLGSININGMGLESAWVTTELVKEREFDVS